MTIEAVLERLGALADDLEEISIRLLGTRETLSPQPRERPPEGDPEAEPEGTVKIRAAIDCVLTDSLGPAIRDLRAVAEKRKKHQP